MTFIVTFTKTHAAGTLAGLPIPGRRVTFPTHQARKRWVEAAAKDATISEITHSEEV